MSTPIPRTAHLRGRPRCSSAGWRRDPDRRAQGAAMRTVPHRCLRRYRRRRRAERSSWLTVCAQPVLFALDRAGAHDEIGHLDAAYDVVILDRYVASNAAYSAARLHQGADGDVVEWVRTLEYERLHLPAPDWQVLLDVPTELAAERAEHRANQEIDRAKDAYERDDGLQRRTGEVYSGLAAAQWCGRWLVAGPDVSAAALAADLGQ